MKRGILFLPSLLMMTCAACSTGQPARASAKHALISSVTEYAVDFETGEWTPRLKTEYSYENGYPVSAATTDLPAGSGSEKTFEYTFDDGQPVTMKEYGTDGRPVSETEYTNGRITEIRTESDTGTSRTILQYAEDNGYFTLLLNASRMEDPEYPEDSFTMEEVDSIAVTLKDGLLEKTVNSGLYANWNDGEEKEWMRFNGTYTAYYDSDGILESTSSVFRAGPPGAEDIVEVTWENGLVKEAVLYIRYEGQDKQPSAKYVFEYTGTEISRERYAAMINYCIFGNSNSYYKYFWY